MDDPISVEIANNIRKPTTPTLIAIGGVPGSGKTTLMWNVIDTMKRFCLPLSFQIGLVKGLCFRTTKACVIGDYTAKDIFSGTDKLSMAVQPHALSLLADREYDRYVFEGDRLFNASFLADALAKDFALKIFVLDCTDAIQKERFRKRGSNQSQTFLAGRVTKIANICAKFPVTRLQNNTPEDLDRNTGLISGLLDARFKRFSGGVPELPLPKDKKTHPRAL